MQILRKRQGVMRHYVRAGFLVGVMALISPCLSAQMPILPDPSAKKVSGAKAPEFDVASVKQNKSETHNMMISTKKDGFACENIPLKTLIGLAYGIKQDLIYGGPGWADSTGFDVEAKVAGPDVAVLDKLTTAERHAMLLPLLADRFKLKLHSETRVLPVYELVAAKGGIKAKELEPVDAAAEAAKDPERRRLIGDTTTGPGEYTANGVTVGQLASFLAYEVHRTVLDKTGIKGIYDLVLKWTPEENDGADDGSKTNAVDAGPSIFTALQEQLGLKLQSSKGPVETLVIDHAEMPSVN